MTRLFRSLALAASAAGLLAGTVPAASAAPAFKAAASMVRAQDGVDTAVHHSREYEWRDRDRDRYRDREWYRDRERYRDRRDYGRHGYYGEPARVDTRVWRGRDGRYYCRREDGTTGLLIGGVVGGLIGNEVAGNGDRTLGTILGVAGGALLGRAIDRSDSRCR